MRASLREHRPFLVLLAAGAVVRVLVQVAFWPGFVFSDGPAYLALVGHLTPLEERAVGYGVALQVLSWIGREVWVVAIAQHVVGLVTAVLAYVLLRRWDVRRWPAALATAPILLDTMLLVLEHCTLSDVLFDLLLVGGVAVLGWNRRPGLPAAAIGGLLLGVSVLVRLVGEPLVLAAVVFCLVAVVGWGRRVVVTGVAVVAFLVPLAGYAAWYHDVHGTWALSESGGRALYMRTTTFVDCAEVDVPDYQRRLCPAEPVGERLDPTDYGWHMPDGNHGLEPPAGTTPNQAMGQFARAAIRAQPGDYLRTVLRDVAMGFAPARFNYYEYDTAGKWRFARYPDLEVTAWTGPAYLGYGGDLPEARQPWADLLVGYGQVVYLPGPLLAVLVLLALAGLLPRRRPAPANRPLTFLLLAAGMGLAIAPDVTAQFVWRYQAPAIVLVPLAAALAWTRLRSSPSPEPDDERGDELDDRAHDRLDDRLDERADDRPGDVDEPAQLAGTTPTPSTD